MIFLLLACATDCPEGSVLGDDGLCYLTDADTGGRVCDGLTWASAGQPTLLTYCTGCHSAGVTGEWRRGAPAGTDFETLAGAHTWQDRIAARMTEGTMPPGGGVPAEQLDRLLAWIDCGAPGEAAPLPPGQTSPIGEAMVGAVFVETDAGALVVVRQAEVGTRAFGAIWSTEHYTVLGSEAWWHGYTLYEPDGAILRSVSFYPEISLTQPGELSVEADVEEDGTVITEDWLVSVSLNEDALPLDSREPTWDFSEVVVLAGEEEHGWHRAEIQGLTARWMILDEDRTWSAIQIGETFSGETGFPLSVESRWLERIVVPGGWSQ